MRFELVDGLSSDGRDGPVIINKKTRRSRMKYTRFLPDGKESDVRMLREIHQVH